MMAVLYYYYFLFYTKVLPDNQPHATVIFSLSFLFSLIVNGILNILLALTFGVALNRWGMVGILAAIIILMYFRFYRNGQGKKIVVRQPKMLNSRKISIGLSLLLFIIGMLFLFFEADLTRGVLESR